METSGLINTRFSQWYNEEKLKELALLKNLRRKLALLENSPIFTFQFCALCGQEDGNRIGSQFRMRLVANAAPFCACVCVWVCVCQWLELILIENPSSLLPLDRSELSHKKKESREASAARYFMVATADFTYTSTPVIHKRPTTTHWNYTQIQQQHQPPTTRTPLRRQLLRLHSL